RGLPSTCFGGGSGSNGSMSDHSSSDTIHGRDRRFPMPSSTSDQADSHMINPLLLEPVSPPPGAMAVKAVLALHLATQA
ncbi:hypothetical protein ACFYSF_45695, partial [Streptomyces canus]